MISIIGGGIGGMTLAIAFEKLGIDYQLYERAPKLGEVGAGIWLAPNPMQVMGWLGLSDAIAARGNAIDAMSLTKTHDEVLMYSPQAGAKAKFGYGTYAIHRAELMDLLYTQLPKEKVHFDKAFDRYEQQGDGALQIHFKDGTSVVTDYLIGADGINSPVRKQLFPQSQTRYTGQTCWRGLSNYELPKSIQNQAFEKWGNQVRFGFSAVSKSQVYWFAVALSPAHQKDNPLMLKQELLAKYTDFEPLVNELISATPDDKILRNDLNDLKPMKHWYNNNVCLMGDAGHATTPNMGQGGAQAIEDAYFLSQIIAQSSNVAEAFNRFQKKRQKRVNQIVQRSWQTGEMAHWKRGQGLRNALFKLLPNAMMTKQMEQLYALAEL